MLIFALSNQNSKDYGNNTNSSHMVLGQHIDVDVCPCRCDKRSQCDSLRVHTVMSERLCGLCNSPNLTRHRQGLRTQPDARCSGRSRILLVPRIWDVYIHKDISNKKRIELWQRD